MREISVLYDGWDLAFRPNSPAALHLLALLHADIPGRRVMVALPGPSFHSLPEHIEVEILSQPDSTAARLAWEQRRLPMLALTAFCTGPIKIS